MKEWLKDDTSWLAHIISEPHYQRVMNLLNKTDGVVAYTGPNDPAKRFVHPSIITDVKTTDSLMSKELFAPFIPVLKADVDTAVSTIDAGPYPLGLYNFSSSQQEIDSVLDRTASGGVTINDVALHVASPGTPFGGVGESGHGAYHGKSGFDAFSHTRPVVGRPDWMDALASFRYGPPQLENVPKFDTAQATWKRGEKLEDQSSGSKSFLGLW